MADIAAPQRERPQPSCGGLAEPPAQRPLQREPADDADDSGTDTDDEGRLIQQAAATAKMRRSESLPPPSAPTQLPPRTAPLPATPRPPPRKATPPPPPPPSSFTATAPTAGSSGRPAAAGRSAPRGSGAGAGKAKAAPKRPAGAITLRTLLDAGFLVPGCRVLYVEYKGLITWADLTEGGCIVCDGLTFESPSAFSIFVKRKLNPERKADDGWKAVKYAGKLLEHFKEQYLRQQLALGMGGGNTTNSGGGGSGSGSGGGVVRNGAPAVSAGGVAVGRGPSPYASAHPSPLRPYAGECNGAVAGEEDWPPSKRQRVDTDGDMAGHCGGPAATSRPGLKIKLKLKDLAASASGPPFARQQGPAAVGRVNGEPAAPACAPGGGRSGPLMPLCAPPVVRLPCASYVGEPGIGEPGSQPFRVEVSDMVVIVMDFHAHCSAAEVGGLLGGTYDAATRSLTISRAFPVLECAPSPEATAGDGERPAVGLELEPTDLARVLDVIKGWGLRCVGSYRSHPAYPSTPNALDVRAAALAQEAARTPDGSEPYVGAIVSPYDPSCPSAPSSAITWFHVEYDRSKPAPVAGLASPPVGCRAMGLEIESAAAVTAHMDVMNLVSTQFQHTARTYAMQPTRAPLALHWRPAGQQSPGSPPETCLDKLVASVVSRLPKMFEGDMRVTYGNMVRDMVQHEFALAARMNQPRGGPRRGSSEDGGWGGGEGGLALERSRRTVRRNGVLAAARFDSEEEETEDDDEEVRLDDGEEAEAEDEL